MPARGRRAAARAAAWTRDNQHDCDEPTAAKMAITREGLGRQSTHVFVYLLDSGEPTSSRARDAVAFPTRSRAQVLRSQARSEFASTSLPQVCPHLPSSTRGHHGAKPAPTPRPLQVTPGTLKMDPACFRRCPPVLARAPVTAIGCCEGRTIRRSRLHREGSPQPCTWALQRASVVARILHGL